MALSDKVKTVLADAVAFLEGLPAEILAGNAGDQVKANLKDALETEADEVATAAAPSIAPEAVPVINDLIAKELGAIDSALADGIAKLQADAEARKAALTSAQTSLATVAA